MNALKRLLSQRQKNIQEESEIMNNMVTEATMVMDFIDTSDEPQGRGSRPVKSSNHHRQRLSRGKNLMENYFIDRPIFSEDDFRRRYLMHPHIFNHIMTVLYTQDSYRYHKEDATGLLGLLPQQKMTVALRMLAYGAATDQYAEICRMGESTTLECQSPVFDKVIAGNSPTVVFHVNVKRYNNAYYLIDGIYPKYSTFVKIISNPTTQSQKLFAPVSQVYDGPVDCNGVRIPFAPVQRDGRNQQAFWDHTENLELAYIHTMLQNDLVEHNWAIEANE
ncbi:uncharacterized protein LOC141660247 [Apium graveolens]|uniref:uncharacterized protein LOC141660247 n=1 Tax=Apium graveolens TaxID=4045 RepID=UPI003D7BDDA1